MSTPKTAAEAAAVRCRDQAQNIAGLVPHGGVLPSSTLTTLLGALALNQAALASALAGLAVESAGPGSRLASELTRLPLAQRLAHLDEELRGITFDGDLVGDALRMNAATALRELVEHLAVAS